MIASPRTNPFYVLRPLAKHFGAEATGVDLELQPLTDEFVAQVRKDVREHRLLVFRQMPTSLSGKRQVEFSSRLGQVESTFYKHPRSPHPDVFRVSNDKNEGCTNVGRTGWHVDGTFMQAPFSFQTMYFPSVCEGGDTQFVALKELYASVGEATRQRWERLWMMTGKREAPVHPLVSVHPYRGDPTMLFHCGPPFVQGWLLEAEAGTGTDQFPRGATVLPASEVQAEITAAIEALAATMPESGAFVNMQWRKHDFAINDNLGLAHYASPGTQDPTAGLRVLHRTTVVGGSETVPRKTDGRRSFFMGAAS